MAVNKVEYAGNTLIDLTGDTVSADKLLSGVTAHAASGEAISGSMTDNGAVSGTISTKAGTYTVPEGYHDGSGKVQISNAEQAKIIAANIREGIKILGVTGTLAEGAKIETGSFTGSGATTSKAIAHGLGEVPNLVMLWRSERIDSYMTLVATYIWLLDSSELTSRFEYCNGSAPSFDEATSAIERTSTTVTFAGTGYSSKAIKFNGTYNYLIGVI